MAVLAEMVRFMHDMLKVLNSTPLPVWGLPASLYISYMVNGNGCIKGTR